MAASPQEMSTQLLFIVQPDFEESLEAQLLELCDILQQPRFQSLQSLRLEIRTSFVENCARFIEAAIKAGPGIRKLDLQMSAKGDLSQEGLARLAAALVMFEEVNLFFFSEEVEPRASEILRATLAASSQKLNCKMKKLGMPGNEQKHAHIIAGSSCNLRDAIVSKKCSFFEHCSNGGGVNPCSKIMSEIVVCSGGHLTT